MSHPFEQAHSVHPPHEHQPAHAHSHAHAHDAGHTAESEAEMAEMLDLDAELLAAQLAEVIDWVGQHATRTPLTIADIGAGTGTGSFALARRFPTAEVSAIDLSPGMLDRLHAAALRHGLAERMRLVQADLDVAWPEIGSVDLAWAASSLHHFDEVDRVLGDVFTALHPGGLFVAVEMDAFPRVLPAELGFGRPGLEDRIQAAIAQLGWNSHPNWRTNLEQAGFEMLEERTFVADLTPAPASAGRYAHAFLSRIRSGFTDELAADDLAALDRLLVADSPEGVLNRGDLSVRSRRTGWAARRP